MAYYECTFILRGDLDESEVDKAATRIQEWIKKEGGSVKKIDKWGKKRLAYRIGKNRYGNYVHLLYELEAGKNNRLERNYKFADMIVKQLTIKISEKEMSAAVVEPEDLSEEGKEANKKEAA